MAPVFFVGRAERGFGAFVGVFVEKRYRCGFVLEVC
jgi:hypothetical protein